MRQVKWLFQHSEHRWEKSMLDSEYLQRACHKLIHLSNELIDIFLSITKVSSLYIMLEFSCSPSACRIRELEWPQKVGSLEILLITNRRKESVTAHLFEVRASSEDFVNKILDAKNIKLSKGFFDNSIVCKRNALLIDFAVSAFVDQFTNRFQVGFTNKELIWDPLYIYINHTHMQCRVRQDGAFVE